MPDFKLFTLAEAERTLPLVRRIVQDLTAEYPAWRAAVAAFELLTGGARADWGETGELLAAREDVARHAERINRFLQELEADRLRLQGIRGGAGGLLLAAGGPADLPVLAAGRGANHPLARDRQRTSPDASRSTAPSSPPCLLVIRLWLFLHLLGFTLWLGGGLASMVAGIAGQAARTGRGLGAVARTQAAVQKKHRRARGAPDRALRADAHLLGHGQERRDGRVQPCRW